MIAKDVAPLYRDATRLYEYLAPICSSDPRPLSAALQTGALRLAEAIVLALKDRDRDQRLDEADERLLLLRLHLRLGESTKLLTSGQALHAAAIADEIGRQLGGWRKKLHSA